jgi:hypothetical protein
MRVFFLDFLHARGTLRPPFAKAMAGCPVRVRPKVFVSKGVALAFFGTPCQRRGVAPSYLAAIIWATAPLAGEGICHRFPGERSV